MIEGGVEEREPGVLGAWAIAGDDLARRSHRTRRQGDPGSRRCIQPRTVVSGRYAFDWGTTARGKETTDGGMSWSVVDSPASPLEGSALASAACGPWARAKEPRATVSPAAGFVSAGEARPRAPDLADAPDPLPPAFKLPEPRGVSLRCEPTGDVAGPAPKAAAAQETRTTPAEKSRPPRSRWHRPRRIRRGSPATSGLPPIFNPGNMSKTPPVAPGVPALANRVVRVSRDCAARVEARGEGASKRGPTRASSHLRLGNEGRGLARSGHLQVRFDDRFDLLGTRTTAVTPAFSV